MKIRRNTNTANLLGFAVFCWMGAMQIAQGQNVDTLWTSLVPEGHFYVYDAIETADGGYLLVGTDNAVDAEGYLLKVDMIGRLEWLRDYGDEDVLDLLYGVVECAEGGFLAVGRRAAYPDIHPPAGYIVRTDADGDTLWTSTIRLDSLDLSLNSICSINGSYIIGGGTFNDAGDVGGSWITMIDEAGNISWTRDYTQVTHRQWVSKLLPRGDSLIAVGTRLYDTIDSATVFLASFDLEGNIGWTRDYRSQLFNQAEDVLLLDEGGILITSRSSNEPYGPWDMWFVKTDAQGISQWTSEMRGPYTDIPGRAFQTEAGDFVVTGWRGAPNTDYFMAGLDSSGDSLWYQAFEWPEKQILGSSLMKSNGDFALFGFQDAVQLDSLGILIVCARLQTDATVVPALIPQEEWLTSFPNPANSSFTIRFAVSVMQPYALDLYNTLGQRITVLSAGRGSPSEQVMNYDASALASGQYFIRLQTHEQQQIFSISLTK